METLKRICPLFLFTIVVLVQLISGGKQSYYVHHSCSNSTQFTITDPFETYLEKLLNYLISTTSRTGFSSGAFGKGLDVAYGHALCRDDLYYPSCTNCVKRVIKDIRNRCPYDKRVVMWYDKCLLKYSDTEFFEQIDRENRFLIMSSKSNQRSGLQKPFNKIKNIFLSQLIKEASTSPKRYSVMQSKLGKAGKVYGFAQCTPDLSYNNCNICLDELTQLPEKNETKIGAIIVSGSCIVRYETYPFSETMFL